MSALVGGPCQQRTRGQRLVAASGGGVANRMAGLQRCLIAVIVAAAVGRTGRGIESCTGYEVYFPMSAVQFNLPINEKTQSIFSKIPLGRFHTLAALDNKPDLDYIYSLEENNLLRINSTTAEVFIRNDYHPLTMKRKFIITAIPKWTSSEVVQSGAAKKISHMSLQVNPMAEEEFCVNLENICFWSGVHYTIVEDGSYSKGKIFRPLELGTLNPRGSKYICPSMDVKYTLINATAYFNIKDNRLLTKVPLDHESLNVSSLGNLNALVKCSIKLKPNEVKEFDRVLDITVVDRNDNGLELQSKKDYNFELVDPHFKANDTIGNKIIFVDKDAMETNSHLTYRMLNDINAMVRPVCNVYETDHTGRRNTIISCQLVFARSGILSQAVYCFQLEASDKTTDALVPNATVANVCLHTNPEKIHLSDRPQTMALRSPSNRQAASVIGSPDTLLNADGGLGVHSIRQSLSSPYPKDLYVHRRALMYARIIQPDRNVLSKADMRVVRFAIAEDRSAVFGITPIGGIVYVKDVSALERSLETVYFLNITWQDGNVHSSVINVHLVNASTDTNNDSTAAEATCDFKVKSRSQTCAQIKYQSQCLRFCGLATNGTACQWRGSNNAMFSRNYATCVPNPMHCPDNVCDPLEELNPYICPQDCIAGHKVMGPRGINDNNRGIFSASGTCICEDNGKCSCAPLDDEEPRPKRKRKNDNKMEQPQGGRDKFVPGNAVEAKAGTNDRRIDESGNLNDPLTGDIGGLQAKNDVVCGKSCLAFTIACPLLLLVLLACLLLARRNVKRHRQGKTSAGDRKALETNGLGHMGEGAGDGNCDARNGDLPLMLLEHNGKLDAGDLKWEFKREMLVLDIILGEGEFGKVVKGYATDIAGISGVTTVAVKMLKTGANSVEHMALLSEFHLLQEVCHPNVIKLLGACTKGDKPMVIIEYARYGSLRGYLRLSRKIECAGVDFTDGVEPVTVKEVLSFAWQICKGMAYLNEIKLVHRDLAARNVLLAEGKICKVSDFGLTRDVYEHDAYLKRSRDRVPVKWMAPESLADHVYTTKSDVWAFAVLCWELITLGASPYPGIPPQNLYHLLKTGYRMERPENCSEEVYSILRSCWAEEPNGRPSFKFLASQFDKLLGNNAKYIELQTNAISNPTYCADEGKLVSESLAKGIDSADQEKLMNNLAELDCLDHLWRPPKMCSDSADCTLDSREFSTTTFNADCNDPPPAGYDMPRPLVDTAHREQALRYENDLRFPLNIQKPASMASRRASNTSSSQNGSRCQMGTVADNGNSEQIAHYAVPVKRGRSYMDMTNKSLIPDNLDINNFEKHLSKQISFRFSSLLNLNEQDDAV